MNGSFEHTHVATHGLKTTTVHLILESDFKEEARANIESLPEKICNKYAYQRQTCVPSTDSGQVLECLRKVHGFQESSLCNSIETRLFALKIAFTLFSFPQRKQDKEIRTEFVIHTFASI